MDKATLTSDQQGRFIQLRVRLESKHGPLMSGEYLSQALGFQTMTAFRQAYRRELLSVHVFSIHNKKGKYALTEDVAYWIASQSAKKSKQI